ncbi:MAG TPA: isopentenyl-diphosphate Delta-isomerase [Gemmatimonadales bacterium]
MTEERVILVNAADQEIGAAEKVAAHRDGLLHRAFSVFLDDRDGQLLLQRRALHKYHSGGLWSNACCGHPRPGESTADAARRRLREELGVETTLTPAGTFTYRAEFANGLVEHEVDHVFMGRLDGEPRPDSREVAQWQWMAVSALIADLEVHPGRYSAWLKPALVALLKSPLRNNPGPPS